MLIFGRLYVICLALGIAAVGSYCIRRAVRLEADEKFCLFWLVPWSIAAAAFSLFLLAAVFEPRITHDLTRGPAWVGDLPAVTELFFFTGALLNCVAPEGKLLPDIRSLMNCVGLILLWAAYPDTLQ